MKKFRLNARNLFLTYPKCYYAKADLFNFLQDKLDIKYCLIAQETHEDGALHLHAYVQLITPCNLNSPKCLDFNSCHGDYRSAKGYYQDNYNYLTKEDQLPFEFGVPNKCKNKSDETKQGIAERNKLLTENSLVDLVNSGEIKVENYLTVKRSVMAFQMDSITVGGYIENKKCFWICDHPRVGKSRRVREIGLPFYTKPMNKWWDGYKQEKIVLLEDMDKKSEFMSYYLKIWADVYSFLGEWKTGTLPCAYQVFIITSNYWPNEIWSEANDPELVKAIEGRFEMVNCQQWDSLEIKNKIINLIK